MAQLTFQYLEQRPDLIPEIETWFLNEWPEYYGSRGPGNAKDDLRSYSHRDTVPLGMIAFHNGTPCGFMALKNDYFAGYPSNHPWIGAAYVKHELRGQGVGNVLMGILEEEALRLGHNEIYCATSTAASLLKRRGWYLIGQVVQEGQHIEIYSKTL